MSQSCFTWDETFVEWQSANWNWDECFSLGAGSPPEDGGLLSKEADAQDSTEEELKRVMLTAYITNKFYDKNQSRFVGLAGNFRRTHSIVKLSSETSVFL